ncbi:hypothetical protein WN944_028747 [Citrus x changshan-huyou]|uniref:Uncharacterized protein n=1 Tax=Citrus x changshan-huyou TaxID=2935761 RepID=A0AAP0LL64_9ROSI
MSTPMVNPPKGDFAGAMVIDHRAQPKKHFNHNLKIWTETKWTKGRIIRAWNSGIHGSENNGERKTLEHLDAGDSFDYISDTVTVLVLHPLGPYLSWLKVLSSSWDYNL